MAKSDTFKFDPQAFLVGTADMSCEVVGAYIRLLCYQWARRGLPDDDEKLAKLATTNSNTIAMLRYKFPVDEDGLLRNARLEMERRHSDTISNQNSQKAFARWQKYPTSEPAKRIAAIFHRSLSTAWSDKEITAFRSIGEINLDELAEIEAFYDKNRGNEKAYLRTGLQAFCNHFRGELDKARQWKHRNNGSHPARSMSIFEIRERMEAVNGSILKIEGDPSRFRFEYQGDEKVKIYTPEARAELDGLKASKAKLKKMLTEVPV